MAAGLAHRLAHRWPHLVVWERRSTRSGYGSGLEFEVLGLIEALSGAFCLAFALFQPEEGSPWALDLVLGVGFLLLAAFTWMLAPRLRDWGLDLSFAVAAVLMMGVVVIRPFDVGQMLGATSLSLLAAFAAYCRPPLRLWLLVTWMLTLYAVALMVSPRMPGPLFFVVAAAEVIAVAFMVSSLMERLRIQALRDPLTGALNRRGLAEQAVPIAAVTRRSAKPIMVGLIDLDRFKRYNDEHGHQAGDRLLADLSRSWQTVLRAGDLLGRVGGDEFAVVLPGATATDAGELVNRMRDVHDAPWTVGFTEWTADEDLYTAIARADKYLYRAKDARHGNST